MSPARSDSGEATGQAAARRVRAKLAAALAVVTALGFGLKFACRGPGAQWAADYGAGAAYEVFWILLVCLVAPGLSPRAAAVGVFLATCGLEFLQLWRPAWLEAARSAFLGAAVLGTTFDWLDFPHYALGCALGWLAAAKLGAGRGEGPDSAN